MEEGIRCLPDAAIALDRFDEDCGNSIGRDLRGKHLLERCSAAWTETKEKAAVGVYTCR